MSAREMQVPSYEITDEGGAEIKVRFWVPRSKFGSVLIVLPIGYAREFRDALEETLSQIHQCEACSKRADQSAFSPEDGDLWFCDECYAALAEEAAV